MTEGLVENNKWVDELIDWADKNNLSQALSA